MYLLVHHYLNYVADLRGLTKADRKANLDMAVTETGIEEVYYKPISTCSKGYRQRTGLAGAILHLPKILIMDEATSAVDTETEQQLQQGMNHHQSGHSVVQSSMAVGDFNTKHAGTRQHFPTFV